MSTKDMVLITTKTVKVYEWPRPFWQRFREQNWKWAAGQAAVIYFIMGLFAIDVYSISDTSHLRHAVWSLLLTFGGFGAFLTFLLWITNVSDRDITEGEVIIRNRAPLEALGSQFGMVWYPIETAPRQGEFLARWSNTEQGHRYAVIEQHGDEFFDGEIPVRCMDSWCPLPNRS